MKKEILQGNRMIAIFMNKNLLVLPSNTGVGEKRGAPIQHENWYNIKWDRDLKYHTSWDWLMPVVEKIEDLGYQVGYTGRMTVINSPKSLKPLYRATHSDGMRIVNMYAAVTQFINWYNQQQPPTP